MTLIDELRHKALPGDDQKAIRKISRERAGLEPVGNPAEGPAILRAFRLLWVEDDRVVVEVARPGCRGRSLAMRLPWLAAAAALASSCGLATHVRPVPKGSLALEAAVGGPAVRVGAPVPLPLSTVGASYGFSERADLSVHTHLSTLLSYGLSGFDVGATFLALEQRGGAPALAIGARGYAFVSFAAGSLFYADATVTASWVHSERFSTYVTLTGQLEFLGPVAHWSPGVGEELRFGRFSLQVEVRWFDPHYDTRHSSVEWLSPFKRGAIGLVLGGAWRVGG